MWPSIASVVTICAHDPRRDRVTYSVLKRIPYMVLHKILQKILVKDYKVGKNCKI